jgi:hypothetical protein
MRSKMVMDGSLQIQFKRLTPFISIILRHSSVSVASRKYSANSGEPFAISTKIIRKMLAGIGKSKSVGPDSVSSESLKLNGEAMIPYLVRLLNITINNATLPSIGKRP